MIRQHMTCTMVTIQLVSDLHIEFRNDEFVDPLSMITPSADVLVLAGDIGSLYKYDQLCNFLSKCALLFKHTLYIPGNHEYYVPPDHGGVGVPIRELKVRLRQLDESIPNFTVLDRECVILGRTMIAGATLWSDMEGFDVPKYIVRMCGISNRLYSELFKQDLAFIESTVEYCKLNNLELVVATHHPPTKAVLEGVNKRDKFRSLYATDLDRLLTTDNVRIWMCGHIHKNFDFITSNGTRVLGNQRGKPKDHITDYRDDLVIKLFL